MDFVDAASLSPWISLSSQAVDANPKGDTSCIMPAIPSNSIKPTETGMNWQQSFPISLFKSMICTPDYREYAQKGNRKTRMKQPEEAWVAFAVGCPTSICKFTSCIGNHSKYIASDILHLECNHAMATARILSEAGRWRKLVSWRVRTS